MSTSAVAAGRPATSGRPEFDAAFALLLLALFLVSSVDEAGLAALARGLALACFAVLTVINTGAAVGVYVGAATVFSVHHFAGQGSWVERPDNYALLMLGGYLVVGRSMGRNVGVLGWGAAAAALLVAVSVARLLTIGHLGMYELSWLMRMFGVPLALFTLLRRASLSLREVRALSVVLAAIGVYLGGMSLIEAAGLYSLIVPPWVADPQFNTFLGLERVGGLLMQPEWNSLVLSLTLCALVTRLEQDRSAGRAGWLLGGSLVLLAIYLTYTRAAWLGLLLAGVPWFWHSSARRGVTARRRVAFLAFLLLFFAVTVVFPSEVTRGRMSDTGTVVYRLHIWSAGAQMVADHPLLGVGFGQFLKHVGGYGQVAGLPQIQDPEGLGDLAHNTLLSVAAELGLVGLTLYVAIMAGIYRAATRRADMLWGEKGRLWVAAYFIVYVVNTQFVTAHELVPNVLFFAVMGAVAGCRGAATNPWPGASAHPSVPAGHGAAVG